MWGIGGSAWLNRDTPDQLPIVKVSAESYGRIARILEKNIPVKLELDMQNTFYDNPHVFNIVAEIPGTDPKLKDELVLMGAHFDSWTYGTGATDNAAGSAMLMEAMRILKSLNLQPRRTIRIGLWTGEEQGALGSAAYVAQHYRASTGQTATTKPGHGDFSVYFNLDGGTGKIRGIFESGNTTASPIFEAWMAPFKDMGMKTVSPWDIGGGDDNSFRSAGIPSFGFMQDPIEYKTRTIHSSADVYERIQPEDLQFNTAVLAFFAWQAAQRDERFPR
jgi:Zn-dependent M28 family amino/carboxypeptidase